MTAKGNNFLYIRGQKTAPFRVRMSNGRSVFRFKRPRASARGASLLTIFISILLIGCTHVRTYTVDKERQDQNLSSGNAGYLTGKPQASALNKDRRLTRKTYVAEVEVGSTPAPKKKQASREGVSAPATVETLQEPANQPVAEERAMEQAPASKTASVSSYTVLNNDTLEKISQKVYGTSRKWKKIYEANSDKLKNPNRIYAGQVLKIPQD
jgi:LysM repeat protein